MKPNVLFITVDSLRADKVYGSNKSSLTPNIDSLINNGVYFTQAISTSDATGLSLGSIFTATYPFKTGITHFNYNPDALNYFDLLKKNGYNVYATIPDVSFFLKLTKNFTNTDAYVYDKRESWVQLVGGIGDLIIDRLENKLKEPWAYFIHLMDLHAPFYLPPEFDAEKYGKTRYDRMVSAIDFWIGRFLQKIDLQKTLVVISADHGDYVPVIDENPKQSTKVRWLIKKGKQIMPALEPVGLKIFTTLNSFKKSYRYNRLRKELTEDELRTLDFRGQWNLYDELLRIPLIFTGHGINSKKIIAEQVRQVDILPTIIDIIKLDDQQNNVNGKSLLALLQGMQMSLPSAAYIETGSRDPKKLGSTIGIRTTKYKYYRSRDDPKQNIRLFNLINDSMEKNNLADVEPKTVIEMEKLLTEIRKNTSDDAVKELAEDERKLIEEELKKLGYV